MYRYTYSIDQTDRYAALGLMAIIVSEDYMWHQPLVHNETYLSDDLDVLHFVYLSYDI